MRVMIREPVMRDREEFLACVRASRSLHGNWIAAPNSRAAFRLYVSRSHTPSHRAFLVCRKGSGDLVGAVNLSEIILGLFRSTYLGYYGFAPHNGQGLMAEGVSLAVSHAFRALRLHRVEANIQPANRASIALVQSLGFVNEGLSRRYLKVAGRWRDHERWATITEEWRPKSRR
jgi:ribosomal-protein-alanine N-acetyltransferase